MSDIENELHRVLLEWFGSGRTLKDLISIVLKIINSVEYKDH